MAYHAKLSPSSAHRWMACPGSVHLAGSDSTAGEAAMRGTAVHKVIETMIEKGETNASAYLGAHVFVHEPGEEETIVEASGSPLPQDKRHGWRLFIMGEDEIAGAQMMIDEVERVRLDMFDPVVFSERFLDMSWLDTRLGGTADVTQIEFGGTAGWIHLFDYKNGRIVVEVDDNEQFLNYAVGLLHEHPDCEGVHVHLVQPNAPHARGPIRDHKYSADEIRLFELKLKEAADATTPTNAPRRAGDWCIFCPAKDRCPEFDGLVAEEAGMDFAGDPVPDYTGALPEPPDGAAPEGGDAYRAALARKARFLPLLDAFVREIRARIQAELCGGHAVGDWKLVRGKSNRVWGQDEATTVRVFGDKWGVPADLLYNAPAMKSPAQVEKLAAVVGKKPKFMKDIVASLSKKPPGKMVAVPASDARPAIDPDALSEAEAMADFADTPAEDFGP